MVVADFDFDLPAELIAQRPLPRRDDSRMMIVSRKDGRIVHAPIPGFPGICESRATSSSSTTRRSSRPRSGGSGAMPSIEFLFIKEKAAGVWDVLCRPAKRVRIGDRVDVPGRLRSRGGRDG